jgi:hypothetical protein
VPSGATEALAKAAPEKNDLALNLKADETADVNDLVLNLKANETVKDNELALNLKANEAFDVRPMAGKPVIEGARKEYGSMFGQIHETLSRYDGNGNNGMVGVADFLGVPQSANVSLGLNQAAPLSPLGLRAVPATQLMSHQSIISNELFGFLDLSSYTQSVGMGVNPTSTTAMLKPAKYLSNLVDGYYI